MGHSAFWIDYGNVLKGCAGLRVGHVMKQRDSMIEFRLRRLRATDRKTKRTQRFVSMLSLALAGNEQKDNCDQ